MSHENKVDYGNDAQLYKQRFLLKREGKKQVKQIYYSLNR